MIIEEKEILLKDGRKAVLRSPAPKEAEEMLLHLRQTSEETHFMVRYPEEIALTVEEERAFLENLANGEDSFMLAAYLEGELAACASLNRYGDQYKYRHRGTFGISVKKKAWGLGIGTAMTKEMLRLAEKTGLEQVELTVFRDNKAARHIYEKLGFEKTGVVPRAFKLKDGSYRDEVQMVYWMRG